jgi:hypothetical protein
MAESRRARPPLFKLEQVEHEIGQEAAQGRSAENDQAVSEHLAAEYRVRTEARGRTVDEWKLKASAVDNHWLDCLVGSAAAASMLGVSLFRGATPKKVVRKRERVAYLS